MAQPSPQPHSPKDEVPPPSVSITVARKQPPPESPEHAIRRIYIILSFWAVVIFLGLPIWWRTTTIYRAKLPLQEMMEWADGKSMQQACRMVFPLQIYIQAPSLQEPEAQHLVRLTQHALDDLNDFSAHHLRLQLVPATKSAGHNGSRSVVSELATGDAGSTSASERLYDSEDRGNAALMVLMSPGESGSTLKATLEAHSPILHVHYSPNQIPSTSATSSPLATYLATQLQDIFAEEQAMISYILSSAGSPGSGASSVAGAASSLSGAGSASSSGSSSNGKSNGHRSLSPSALTSLSRRLTLTAKYAPTYHLTFSLFTPGSTPSSWSIETALSEYLDPLLSAISPTSNFTIDTQVQLYARFSPSVREPEYDAELQAWTLKKEDLSGFINAAEWPLSPSIGAAPTLNFVVYVPPMEYAPLVVKETGGTSWLVPQWGGVVILNAPEGEWDDPVAPAGATTTDSSDVISTDDNRSPAQQRRRLNPPTHLSSTSLKPALTSLTHHLLSLLGAPSPSSSTPLHLRLQPLPRLSTTTLLLSASSTLGSLARLSLALPSISIPSTVASATRSSMVHLRGACADLAQARFASALRHARIADRLAEKAFFDKAMVGQVYFPDEHKVAVYLPLLGPVGVPLVMGLVREVRKWISGRRVRNMGARQRKWWWGRS